MAKILRHGAAAFSGLGPSPHATKAIDSESVIDGFGVVLVPKFALDSDIRNAANFGTTIRAKGTKLRLIDKGPVLNWALMAVMASGVLACTPTVRVEAPREPITINLNVRLDADVRVRLEEQAREDIRANPGIF